MTETELESCFRDLEEKEAFDEYYASMPTPDEQQELPSCCERCGNPFGGFAVKVGDRWVCSVCEKPEYEDHVEEIQAYLSQRPQESTAESF